MRVKVSPFVRSLRIHARCDDCGMWMDYFRPSRDADEKAYVAELVERLEQSTECPRHLDRLEEA